MKNNLQINGNVYGGVHFHGRAKLAPVCDVVDEPLPRASYAPGLAITFGRVLIRLWRAGVALVKLAITFGRVLIRLWRAGVALVKLACGLGRLCAWLMYGLFAVSLWAVTRLVDGVQIVLRGFERSMGGAPTHLIHVPNLMQPREPEPHQLGPGNPHQLADIHTRETDYVDAD